MLAIGSDFDFELISTEFQLEVVASSLVVKPVILIYMSGSTHMGTTSNSTEICL